MSPQLAFSLPPSLVRIPLNSSSLASCIRLGVFVPSFGVSICKKLLGVWLFVSLGSARFLSGIGLKASRASLLFLVWIL